MTNSQAVELKIELGRTRLELAASRRLRGGDLVPLDASAGDPVELYAAGRRIGRGETVAVDGRLGVRILELVTR